MPYAGTKWLVEEASEKYKYRVEFQIVIPTQPQIRSCRHIMFKTAQCRALWVAALCGRVRIQRLERSTSFVCCRWLGCELVSLLRAFDRRGSTFRRTGTVMLHR